MQSRPKLKLKAVTTMSLAYSKLSFRSINVFFSTMNQSHLCVCTQAIFGFVNLNDLCFYRRRLCLAHEVVVDVVVVVNVVNVAVVVNVVDVVVVVVN